jgi:DNA-binding transcriptional ArsR family regulator
MVEYINDATLTAIFKAVCDPTRRQLLTQLCQQGSSRVTDLADYYDMSLNAISKHIKVLESAGLVTRKTEGRIHWIDANLTNTALMETWLSSLKSIWSLRLDKLESILNEET